VQSPIESIDWVNIMPYGEPGVGKTRFAATALDHPELRPVLYLDVDGGVSAVRKRHDLEVKQVRSMDTARGIYNELYASVDWEAEKPSLPYKVIVIDTVSELAKLDMRVIAKAAHDANPRQHEYVPSQREYLIGGERMREIVRAYRDLPCHTIFCCHSGDGRDNSNATIFFPQFSGKLRHEIAGFLDVVGFMTADTDKGEFTNFMQVQKTKKVAAKDRFDCLGEGGMITNPTMPDIYDSIKASVT
jgi:hypothetical protein